MSSLEYSINIVAKRKFMTNQNVIYILLDFSCGRFYTHHSSYLSDYESFLNKLDVASEVWINSSADRELLDILSPKTKPILRSIMYSFSRHENFMGFLQDKIISKLFVFLVKVRIPNFFIELLKASFAFLYYKSALKRLKKLSNRYDEIVLVFPTFDALSFRLTNHLVYKSHLPIKKICIRVTGAEKRGAFSATSSETKLVNLVQEKSEIVNVGIEVNCYKELLARNEFDPNKIYWAPMPEVKRVVAEKVTIIQDPRIIKIGFLGSARKTKGFEDLPEIFSKLIENKVNFMSYVQLPNFLWDEAKSVISVLRREFPNFVEFIPGGSSREVIEGYIAEMDLVLLPYSVEAYKYAGSGILYLAADLIIPIFAQEELAFAWDIEKFGIGETYSDYTELAIKLKHFSKFNYIPKILKYNLERNLANNLFVFNSENHPGNS
jgi:hypothetical protein